MLLTTINKFDHFWGNTNAKVAVTVFEDYECEYCGKAFRELRMLRQSNKADMFIIYKNFPNVNTHPHALLAARVVEACALQNRFIQAHDLIFEDQEYLEYGLGGILRLLEKDYGVCLEKLNDDLKKTEVRRKVNDDIASGIERGLKDTPAIFINGEKYEGDVTFAKLQKVIRQFNYAPAASKVAWV